MIGLGLRAKGPTGWRGGRGSVGISSAKQKVQRDYRCCMDRRRRCVAGSACLFVSCEDRMGSLRGFT